MSADEWLGCAGFALVTAAFWRFGNRRGALAGAVALALAGLSPALLLARWEPVVLIGLGLALYGAGLTLASAMLERSVTLRLLQGAAEAGGVERAHAELAGRAAELVERGLAVRCDDRLVLTRNGRLVAGLAAAGRAWLGERA